MKVTPRRSAPASRPFRCAALAISLAAFACVFFVVIPVTARGATPATAAATSAPAVPSAAPTVVFLGDSLTAGLGVEEGQAWPARVAERLEAEGAPIHAVNAGVSGDTSAGGVRRLDWLLKQKPKVVVISLGANDGLRGLAVEDTEKNLRQIVGRSRQAGARVLLCGMLLPPNYGEEYRRRFSAIFPKVASSEKASLLPFLLEGVAGDASLNGDDGIHPNAQGHEVVAGHVLGPLRELLSGPAPAEAPKRRKVR